MNIFYFNIYFSLLVEFHAMLEVTIEDYIKLKKKNRIHFINKKSYCSKGTQNLLEYKIWNKNHCIGVF